MRNSTFFTELVRAAGRPLEELRFEYILSRSMAFPASVTMIIFFRAPCRPFGHIPIRMPLSAENTLVFVLSVNEYTERLFQKRA